jgi:hypothetical protein
MLGCYGDRGGAMNSYTWYVDTMWPVTACLHVCRWSAYVRWAVWLLLGTAVYVFYSMHHTQASELTALHLHFTQPF